MNALTRMLSMTRRRIGTAAVAGLLATTVGLVGASSAAATFSQNFCGHLVDDNTWCKSPSPAHSFNFVSVTYPGTSLYTLCNGEVTDAGNWKAARAPFQSFCGEHTDYHGTCFNPLPYARGAVQWGAIGASTAQHTLNGWATTTGAGCPV